MLLFDALRNAKDIENAYFTLMWQFVQKLTPDSPMPDDALKALERCAKSRAEVIEELKVSKADGKQILIEVVNGGSPPAKLSEHDVIVGLRKVSIWIKWLAVTKLPDLYSHCCSDKSKAVPENSVIAYLYQALEDLVLSSWIQYLLTLDLTHLSLHFDGCRIQGQSLDIPQICQLSCDWIARDTGFHVVLKEKRHFLFLELLQKEGQSHETLSLSSAFTCPANGILTCLAYITEQWAPVGAWLEKHPVDETAGQKHRSYKECLKAAERKCLPALGYDVEKNGKYLLHCEHDGSPLVVGCVAADNVCRVLAGSVVYELPIESLRACHQESIDFASLVTFRLLPDGEDPSMENADILLELQAGCDVLGGGSSSDAAGASELDLLCECEGLLEDSEDEGAAGSHADEAVVRAGDKLLALLSKERNEVLDSVETVQEGSAHRCPLCPFRLFSRPGRVTEHVRKYHNLKRQFCCSGTKQVRVIQALFDDDQLRARQPNSCYLRRSAALIRTSVRSEDGTINHLDRRLRLVLTDKGPVYKKEKDVAEENHFYRRAKNLYYTQGFANMLFQEMMLCNAKLKQVSGQTFVYHERSMMFFFGLIFIV